ncbi:N-terminal nucleophile aminohydrolase [Basidiobolus meristosporus CBS 931.73]|uniref:N-terminal nucleophile aminohydrolase n=1 Tax=Basidiobolus meristosporus CBS 931.73 TaxID=1314790 RepID=A0A1Y1X088_9FUNG|nr:N-terminal nucleophile aminohydrolase [Basidiobolus meristosporus CBS 931.73]|eukprot:ORX79249.1 N-terminal nucleophile aminohydrolase [Basidiobolus meristosporus CBS 931.73]
MTILRAGGSALDAVEEAIKVLENDPFTNAGFGSNLNLVGEVECDASVMEGLEERFASVGAVSGRLLEESSPTDDWLSLVLGIYNPISAAARLLRADSEEPLSLGRISPIFLAGDGARKWAKTQQIQCFNPEEGALVSSEAKASYHTYIERLQHEMNRNSPADCEETEVATQPESRKKARLDRNLMDTVGAICIDSTGNLASGVSSGGICLKFPGRVGEAAVYGAGCWAQNPNKTPGFACSVTGTGEQIMKILAAKTCCDRLVCTEDTHSALDSYMQHDFLDGEFWYTHSTPSMVFTLMHKFQGIGYMSDSHRRPKTTISRLNSDNNPGYRVSGVSFTT